MISHRSRKKHRALMGRATREVVMASQCVRLSNRLVENHGDLYAEASNRYALLGWEHVRRAISYVVACG